jgi:hypothetical protein
VSKGDNHPFEGGAEVDFLSEGKLGAFNFDDCHG